MSVLHLVRLAVDPRALAAFAVAQGVDDDDRGYALHLALRRRLGAAAPQPFRYFADARGGPYLLGYASSADAFGEAADLPLLGDGLGQVFPHRPECRPMPEVWRSGARYGFEVRVRPVVRYGGRVREQRSAREGAWRSRAGELDAFLAACDRADGASVERETVYRDWLSQRLAGAAEIGRASCRERV